MAQVAFLPPLGLERMVTALQEKPDAPPGQRLANYRDVVQSLELFCAMPQARAINPATYRMMWAYAKPLREALSLELTMISGGASNALLSEREELEELLDRASELVDSFALAANAQELVPLVEGELREP